VAVSVEDRPDDIRLSDLEALHLFGVWSPLRRYQAGLAVPNVRQRIDPGEAVSRNRAFPAV
jgi:hypothetical protein